jgi:hypothetical protein
MPDPLPVPTAVQSAAETHETAVKRLSVAPVGLGVGRSVQLVPSHCSATVTTLLLMLSSPTATHLVDVAHEMAERSTAESGLGSPVSIVPFHESA